MYVYIGMYTHIQIGYYVCAHAQMGTYSIHACTCTRTVGLGHIELDVWILPPLMNKAPLLRLEAGYTRAAKLMEF